MKGKNAIIIAGVSLVAIGLLVWFLLFRTDETKYTVKFDTDGGSSISEIIVKENETVTKPSDPIKSGYTFVNWQLDGNTYDFNSKITNDITLKATWAVATSVDSVTIKFDQGDSKINTQSVTSGGIVTKPSDPTKEGYTFIGWYNGDTEFDFSKPVTENMTLTAKFEEIKYTVTFNSDGGSKVASQSIAINKTATKPSNPTRSGYTFANWQLDGKNYNFSTKVTKNITLKAVWNKKAVTPSTPEPTKYTVTFNSDGGSAVSNQSIVSGEKASAPSNPTRNGYAFKGWKLNNNAYDFNTAVTGNITLKATWEEVITYTYKITAWAESDIQSKVNVYRNSTDISQAANRVFTSDKGNLGSYSPSAGAILVNKNELNSISKIYYNNEWITITKQ